MTDQIDFEATLERRLAAYAASGVRPVAASAVARSTIAAAATPITRTSSVGRPRRPALLIALAAVLLLVAVAGAAFVGGLPRPIQGVFTEGPTLDEGSIVNAIALPDGRVLVGVRPEEGSVPGTTTLDCNFPCKSHLMVLDPASGTYSKTADWAPPLDVESMALLHDGRVLILHGSDEDGVARPATVYDPVADRYAEVGAPTEERAWPFLVTLQDGRVLVGGGAGGVGLPSTELFDPDTGTFARAGSMGVPRGFGAIAVTLEDGRVLLAGGGAEVGTSAELFDPTTGAFTPTGSMTVARGALASATRLPDGRVLVAGGLIPDAVDPERLPEATATAEIYDPETGTFSAVGSMSTPRYWHAGELLSDGTVLIAAGGNKLTAEGAPVTTADAEIFDPTTRTFRPTGSLHRARIMPASVTVDDRVLILGNMDPIGDDPEVGATTEWFD